MDSSTNTITLQLPGDLLDWLRRRAEEEQTSLAAVLADAVTVARRARARAELLAYLGDASALTPEEEQQLLAEWGNDGADVRHGGTDRSGGA